MSEIVYPFSYYTADLDGARYQSSESGSESPGLKMESKP